MTRSARAVLASVLGLLLAAGAYGVAFAYYHIRMEFARTAMWSDIKNLRSELIDFHNRVGDFPKHPGVLRLRRGRLIDAVSGEHLGWWTQEQRGQRRLFEVAWQPKPYRTELFPFGEVRQQAILSNGRIIDLFDRHTWPRDGQFEPAVKGHK